MIDVELTIDELVIGGVGDVEARRIGQMVTLELKRLLEERGVPERETHQAVLLAPVNRWQPGATPEQIGVMIAQTIYSALG
jgi:hypothetical protein